MKPYSLDMRQKIVNTYEAGHTSVRKVAERFLLFAKVRYRNYSNKKERQENYSLVRQKGETEPTLWSRRTDQRDGSRTSRLHVSRIL